MFPCSSGLACVSLPAFDPACGLVLDAEYEALLVRARATAAAQAAARGLDASAVEPVVPPRPEFPPPYLLLQVIMPTHCVWHRSCQSGACNISA